MLPYFLLVGKPQSSFAFCLKLSLTQEDFNLSPNLTSFIFSPCCSTASLEISQCLLTIIGNDLLFMPLQICCKWQFWTIYHPQASLCITFEALHFLCIPSASWVSFLGLTLYPYSHPQQLCTKNSHSLWFYHYPLNFHSTCSVLGFASILLLSNISYHLKALNLYIKRNFSFVPSSPSASKTKIFTSSPNLHILRFLIWIVY